MKFAGIIAEYDPFHNGHAWQLAQAKALGAERVAVAMSCSLVQRGALPLLPDASTDRLEAGLDPVAFEQALRRSLPGTYTVYQQLNTKRKQQLYQAYQNNNQLASISERAAQLLGGKP